MGATRKSNPYFRCKQFTVFQRNAGLKVTTDACIFGAWIHTQGCQTVLDIGTGTGLLTLMDAQKNANAHYTAVEIDTESYLQACENFTHSPWAARITCLNSRIQDFAQNNNTTFDAIICNPPFFHHHLLSHSVKKNTAKHSHALPMEELATCVTKMLHREGVFFVMFPAYEADSFAQVVSSHGLYVHSVLKVFNFEHENPIRHLVKFGFSAPAEHSTEKLIIYSNVKTYTPALVELLKDYYL